MILVKNYEAGYEYRWTREKFKNRFYLMADLRANKAGSLS
jgi:myosin heavy subunit